MDSGLSIKGDILVNLYIFHLKCDGDDSLGNLTPLTPSFQEKLLWLILLVPVPRTDTGRQGEYPKVSERTMAKELGKIAP